MFDKATETKRAMCIKRQFPKLVKELGFVREPSGALSLRFGSHVARIGLQKFTSGPRFRVIMSLDGHGLATPLVEFSDKYTYRDSPSGHKYDFTFRFGDDAEKRCVEELKAFVVDVAMAWFVAVLRRIHRNMTPLCNRLAFREDLDRAKAEPLGIDQGVVHAAGDGKVGSKHDRVYSWNSSVVSRANINLIFGQHNQINILAHLGRAVEHAGLPAH